MTQATPLPAQSRWQRWGDFVTRHWLAVLLAWGLAAAGIHWLAPDWDEVTLDGDLAYLPAEMSSVRGEARLAQFFPGERAKSQIVLVFEASGRRLTREDLAAIESVADAFRPLIDSAPPGDQPPASAAADALPLVDLWTPETEILGEQLRSRDGHAALAVLYVKSEFMAIGNIRLLGRVRDLLASALAEHPLPQGLVFGLSGSAAVGADANENANQSVKNTELTTTIILVVILLLVYRAPLLAAVPLATIFLSTLMALDLTALLVRIDRLPGCEGWNFHVFKTTKIFIISILFGSGTDYCLFLIARFREELEHGSGRIAGLSRAVGGVSEALCGSALTTIFGLGMMFFADFGKFRNSGPAIGFCLAITLLACLSFSPALLRAFGGAVFWPFHPRPRVKIASGEMESRSDRFWTWASSAILRRPGLLWLASLAVLAPVAYCGTGLPLSYNLLEELGPDSYSVQGTQRIERHFTPGETGPVTVVAYLPRPTLIPLSDSLQVRRIDDRTLEVSLAPLPKSADATASDAFLERPLAELSPAQAQRVYGAAVYATSVRELTADEVAALPPETGGWFNSRAGLIHSALLTKDLTEIAGIQRVRSIAEPLGDVPGVVSPFSPAGRRRLAALRHPRTKAHFVSQTADGIGQVSRLELALSSDPFSRTSRRTLDGVDEFLLSLTRDPHSPWFGAEFDYVGTTAGTRDLEQVLQSDETLIQRLVVLAVLAVLIVMLRRVWVSIYLLATVVFSYLVTLGASHWVFSRVYPGYEGLDWKVPLFLFVILIAVGEDYNIYLATRMIEEQEQRRSRLQGLHSSLAKTGGIITSCGVIMVGTFASMLTGTLRGVVELGFSLSLGIALDTFVVRPVLVPALLGWIYRLREPPSKTTSHLPDAAQPVDQGELAGPPAGRR